MTDVLFMGAYRGVASLGWKTSLYSYKGALEIDSKVEDIFSACDADVDIINMSWGFYLDNSKLYNAVKYAVDTCGVVCVVAAGNDQRQAPYDTYPGMYDEVIAVAATDFWDVRGVNYNYGNWIDCAAPGIDVWLADYDATHAKYDQDEGTSYAAPMVAALAALILEVNPNLDPYQVRAIILNSCEKVGEYEYTNGKSDRLGYGRINAKGALVLAQGQGHIDYDMHWCFDCDLTHGNNYLYVDSGSTLTIEPGVVVTFNGDSPSGTTRLVVNGNLAAAGTPFYRISFTSDSPSENDFEGVYISENADASTSMIYCNIERAYHGIWLNEVDPDIEFSHINISDCVNGMYIRYCHGKAPTRYLGWYNGIEDCLFGTYVLCSPEPGTGSMKFYHDVYTGNTTGARCYSQSNPCYERCLIAGNNHGIWTAVSSYPNLDYLNNSIKANNTHDIWNQSGADTIWARGNWWGEAYGDPTYYGNVEWDPSLGSEPDVGFRPLPWKRDVADDPGAPPGELAQFERDFHDYALEIHSRDEILAYLDDMINTTEDADVSDLARLFYWSAYRTKETLAGAVAGLESLIQDTANGDIRKNVFFILGEMQVGDFDDRERARSYFKYLFDNYPDDGLSIEAHVILRDDPAEFMQPLARLGGTAEEQTILFQNYPNPFNPETDIQFALGKETPVIMTIYNVRGQLVRTLVEKRLPAGIHKVHWNGRDDYGRQVPTGVYFLRFRADSMVQTRKMVLIK